MVVVVLALWVSSAARPLLSAAWGFAPISGVIALPAPLSVLFPLCWAGIQASLGLYDGRKHVRAADEFAVLSLASLLAGVSLAGILYFSFRDVSRAQYILFLAVSYTTLVGWRAIARIIFRFRREHLPALARRIIIVGAGPIGRMVEARLQDNPELHLSLAGFVDEGQQNPASAAAVLGRISDLPNIVDAQRVTDVIIALPPHFYEQIRLAASSLNDVAVRVWIALGFFDLALYRTATEDFAGLPLLDLRASALDDYERTVKRAFDIALGGLALIALAPLLAISACMIWLQDGRPILFRQKRVGENGKVFNMYKLRTMVKNAEDLRHTVESRDPAGNIIHKTKHDPRITPIGGLLRRFSIDELPQLIHVLKGDMSLVGPRPELPHLVEQYQPWQRQRFAVPPGITGWWQVTGRSDRVMHLHTEDDLYYLQNYSLWLDLQIIMRTLWVVLLGQGAY
jgi:exopolysaccharide biosynthesis polyprenyl glycosylphosphotransferase